MTQGEFIQKARTDAGLTMEELAQAIGTTKQTIYKYEADIVTNIPMDKIKAMADVLNVTPTQLLGWDDSLATNEDLEMLHKNPDLRILLSASKDLRKSDIDFLVSMARRMNGDDE